MPTLPVLLSLAVFSVSASGCYLSHERLGPSGGRAVLSDDDDWFRPGLPGIGDAAATQATLTFVETGLASPRILICGTRETLDSSVAGWRTAGGRSRTIGVEAGCAGRLGSLLSAVDVVLIEYVTTAPAPWALPPPEWTAEDQAALRDHLLAGGRAIVLEDLGVMGDLFAALGVRPTDLALETAYDYTSVMDVHDTRGDRIGQARLIGHSR